MFNKIVLVLFSVFLLLACETEQQQASVYVEPSCMAFQKSCQLFINEQPIKLLFDSEKITPEYPFGIYLVDEGSLDKFEYSGYLEGVNMYMGKIPLFFHQQINDNFKADTMLGSCSEDHMVWRVWIIAKDKKTQVTYKASVDFEVTN